MVCELIINSYINSDLGGSKEGKLYELVVQATIAEDFKPLSVYRELFRRILVLVGPSSAFASDALLLGLHVVHKEL